MEPITFCQQAMHQLRISSPTEGRTRVTDPQAMAVLSYFVHRRLSADEFVRELTDLQRRSERIGRRSLADAAGRLLEVWHAEAEADRAAG